MTPIAAAYTRDETLLSIDGVYQRYGDNEVLSGVTATIKDLHCSDHKTTGQVLAVVGPSGVGKSQLLRIMAGLQKPTIGSVFIDPDRKPITKGMVGVLFQRYPLWQHRSVLGNLSLAGTLAGMSKPVARDRAYQYLEMFDLTRCSIQYPAELSGGMQQRVAICQQLMNMDGGTTITRMILMDEPFAALDPHNTRKTCALIRKVADLNETNTMVVVTHDLRAALSVGDYIWVMGRDRDANGKVCSGGKIVAELDLVQQGLAWHPEVELMTEFVQIERELFGMFSKL